MQEFPHFSQLFFIYINHSLIIKLPRYFPCLSITFHLNCVLMFKLTILVLIQCCFSEIFWYLELVGTTDQTRLVALSKNNMSGEYAACGRTSHTSSMIICCIVLATLEQVLSCSKITGWIPCPAKGIFSSNASFKYANCSL